MHLYGIRFFYELTLQRPWPVLDLMRPRKRQTRPIVLSPQEVRSVLVLVEHPKAQMYLRMIYACGLRLTEGTHLQGSDIHSQRMLVLVRGGKGGKDRLVPMPRSPTSLQKTFNAVVRQSGIPTDASIHPLRHSSATHLLERGVSLRVMQARLGHLQRPLNRRALRPTPGLLPSGLVSPAHRVG